MKQILIILSVWLCIPTVAQEYAQITHFGVEEGLMERTVSRGMQDSYGYIWFSTHNGLVRYDGSRFVTYKARPGDHCPLATNLIDYIEEMPDHDILCLSQRNYYIFHRATATFEYLRPDDTPTEHDDTVDSVVANRISRLKEFEGVDYKIRLIDRQGGVWVRSSRGLERVTFPRRPIATLKFDPAETEEYVSALMTDRQGRLWISDRKKFVRILSADRQHVSYLTPTGELSSRSIPFGSRVCAFLEDSKGRIWLGARKKGLFLLTPNGADKYSLRQYCKNPNDVNSLNDSTVYAILEDTKHRIWIGCYDGGGLNMAEEKDGQVVRFVHFRNLLKKYPQETGGRVRCLRLIGDTLLIGTNFGLVTTKIEKKPQDMVFYINQRNADDASTLSNNRVMGIETDKQGRVYLATHGGGICLTRADSLLTNHIRFTNFSTGNGLLADVCLDIYRDNRQQMWVDSEYFLSQINADEGTFTNYRKSLFQDGFIFTEADPQCLNDGTLIFGTTQGILHFNIDDIRKSSFVPPIMVELRYEDGTIRPCPENLKLSADEKNFQLLLAALDYNRNEKIFFAYKLESVDQEWHYTSNALITYTSFPPGTYRLHIKSTNGDGLWVGNEKVITIYRRAAFRESPYAGMLYGVLIVLVGLVIFSTVRYIRLLQREMSTYRLAAREKMEYMEIRIQELMNRKLEAAHLAESSNGQPMAARLEQESGEGGREEADEQRFRERVDGMMQRQLGNSDLTIDDCAREMLMSRSAFYLRVKKNYGVSPNALIQNARLQYAIGMIRDTGDAISDIAYRAGFSDPKYFSRTFKRATGLTPTEYREQRR